MSGKVQLKVSNQKFVNSRLANSLSVKIYCHCSTHLITSSALNECLLVHNFHNNCMLHRMPLMTRNAKEYRSMTAQLMSQNLPIVSCSFGIFCAVYVILTISYLRAQTIETSSLPTDSSRPLFKQIEIFSILTV